MKMEVHQANGSNNDSSNVGYSRLIDGIVPNGVNGGCCYRKHHPWQLKLIFILIGVLLGSRLAYYSFTNNSTFLLQSPNVQRQFINSFTYGKTDSKFYESGFNDYVGAEKLHKLHNITKNAGNRRKSMKKFITECKLPRVNPWDPAIEPYLDPTYNIDWDEKCKREYPELTTLVDGYVVMHSEAKANGTHCQFRCLLPHTDYEFIEGYWKEINEQPDCDIVETRCHHKALQNNEFYYNYLHAQIYRRLEYKLVIFSMSYCTKNGLISENQEKTWNRSDGTSTPKSNTVDIERTPNFEDVNRRAPDVHVIVLDSLSHTQFLRTHPKTVMWLRERMGAIPFPHLNKNGLNSRPNGYGLFFGIQAYPVPESPMGEGYTPPRNLSAMGGIYLDHEPFVGFEYREKNYRTMMAEDWGKGVFNWPSNYGFERQPVEHYMRPFQLRFESHPDKLFTKNLHDKSCRESHHYIMEYLTNFINAYEEQPKFSISWMSDIGHNYVNGPYRLDKVLFKFLLDYEMKLNNSFVFIMGDHGLRFGGVRWTKQGEIEDNNPALFLVLPAHLRYNDNLVNNLRHNSRQLITHFDIHATLVNIARQTNMTVHSTFQELAPELKGPTPFGQSLLYPFNMSIPRNCATLKIPFEFCQCQFETKNATETEPKLGMNLAKTMVTKMNADLAEKDATENCTKLEVNQHQKVEIIEFEPNQNFDVFKVTYETIPGNGKFWGYMKVQDRGQLSQNFTFISTRFSRLNEYKAQSYCTEDYAIAPYCYCNELLKATTTTETPTTTLLK